MTILTLPDTLLNRLETVARQKNVAVAALIEQSLDACEKDNEPGTTLHYASERHQAETALLRRDAILSAVAFTAEQFLRNHSLEVSINVVLERLGQAAHMDRAYIFKHHTAADGTAVTSQIAEWVAPGISVQLQNELLQNTPLNQVGWETWHQELKNGQAVARHTKQFPPDVQDFLKSQSILSLAAAPIFTSEYLWGYIGFDVCQTEREWSQAELDALKTAADTLGAAIERQNHEAALRLREIRITHQNDALLQLATLKALGAGDLDTTLREITRVTSAMLKVAQVGVWFYQNGQSALHCELRYHALHNTYENGIVLQQQAYPTFFTALSQNRVIVVDDAYTDPAMSEFAAEYLPTYGVKALLDAPIRVGGITIGVVCCEHIGTARVWSLDDQQFVAGVADLVALALEARDKHLAQEALRRSQETALEFQQKLRQTHEIILELAQETALVDIYRRAIELGRSVLGFDRLGLWLLNPARDALLGTFGTNEQGQLRDEREFVFPLEQIVPYILDMFHSKTPLVSHNTPIIKNSAWEIDPPGAMDWNVIATLWNGSEGIGFLSADNYLGKAPMRPYEDDLLTFYATTLGNLITQRQTEERLTNLVNQLTLLSTIDRAILRSDSSASIAASIVQPLQMLVDCDYVSILLVDPAQQVINMIAHTADIPLLQNLGCSEFVKGIADKLSKGVAVPIQISDELPGSELIAYLNNQGIQFITLLPLLHDVNLVGVLALGTTKPHVFNAERLYPVEQVAAQLSVALRQNALYQQVQDYAESLERKVAERTRQLEAKAEEIEAFNYSVSHDLRAPLRAINGFSNVLLAAHRAELSENVQHYLDRIHSNAQRMGQLIDDLLMFSRIGRTALRKKPIDMQALVRTLLTDLKADIQMGNAIIMVADLPPCTADAALLKQVYVNLVTNAIKYSHKVAAPVIQINYEVGDNQEIIYYIRDNGVGFDMQYADKLFGVFQRLHDVEEYDGTGIGLALVRQIIKRHGGKVWAEGRVNGGATFYFTLPPGTDELVEEL
jgi:signal transduction histidine kinase